MSVVPVMVGVERERTSMGGYICNIPVYIYTYIRTVRLKTKSLKTQNNHRKRNATVSMT